MEQQIITGAVGLDAWCQVIETKLFCVIRSSQYIGLVAAIDVQRTEADIETGAHESRILPHLRPGPAQSLSFCGSTLRQSIFWVPQSGDVAVGVSIFSYGGGVQFALITDERLCPEPQQVIDRFAPEMDKLLWVTLMLPWAA